MVHTLKGGFSLDPNKSTSYRFVRFISFGPAWVLEESWRTGGKSSGKNMPKNPLHSPLESLLNIWPVLIVSSVWSLAQRRKRTEETPLACVTATGAQRITPLGHTEEQPLQSPSIVPLPPACSREVQGNRKREIVKVPPAIGARTSYLNRRSSGIWDWAMWAFCWVCFSLSWFPSRWAFPCAGFLRLPLLARELCWVELLLCLASSMKRLFQPGYIRVMAP